MNTIPPGGWRYAINGVSFSSHTFEDLVKQVERYLDAMNIATPENGVSAAIAAELGLTPPGHQPLVRERATEALYGEILRNVQSLRVEALALDPADCEACETCSHRVDLHESSRNADVALRLSSILTGTLVPDRVACSVAALPIDAVSWLDVHPPVPADVRPTLPQGCPILARQRS